MWQLILSSGERPILIDTFSTKREAQNEINYRSSVTQHLGYNPKEIYKIRKVSRRGRRNYR